MTVSLTAFPFQGIELQPATAIGSRHANNSRKSGDLGHARADLSAEMRTCQGVPPRVAPDDTARAGRIGRRRGLIAGDHDVVVVRGVGAERPRVGRRADDHTLGDDRQARIQERRDHGRPPRLGQSRLVGAPLDHHRPQPPGQPRRHQVEPRRPARGKQVRTGEEVAPVEHEPVMIGLGPHEAEVLADIEPDRRLDEVLRPADERVAQLLAKRPRPRHDRARYRASRRIRDHR